jgi:hypothetical protein
MQMVRNVKVFMALLLVGGLLVSWQLEQRKRSKQAAVA